MSSKGSVLERLADLFKKMQHKNCIPPATSIRITFFNANYTQFKLDRKCQFFRCWNGALLFDYVHFIIKLYELKSLRKILVLLFCI